MNGRRALAELLSELADTAAAWAEVAGEIPVQARTLSVSLPIDLRVASTDQGLEVIGDVPLFRTRTDFDTDPSRLEVDWQALPRAREDAS